MPTTETSVMEQLDFSGLEDRVRSRDPETSWAAAQQITDRDMSQLKRDILGILNDHPEGLTDDEIYATYRRRDYTPRSPQRVRTSRHEITILARPALVQMLSEDGKTELGNPSQIWGITDAGKAVIS
jgi:hypothetical protein